MKLRTPLVVASLILAFLVSFLLYENFSTLTATELNQNAQRYDGHLVTVRGKVSSNAGILGTGGFTLSDNETSVLVISKSGIPKHGSSVEVTGTFRKAVSLNNFEYNVVYSNEE